MKDAAVDATGLYRFYHAGDEETLALRGVSLRVQSGETVAVTGPSGSGKSTLLGCLAGLDNPDGGVVKVAGELVSRRSETDRARVRARHIGVLFQADNLIGHLTVADNVALAQRLAGRGPRQAIEPLLDRLGLSSRRRARPSELSGGEAARAGLAVALANDPAVLLADEPTGELDDVTEERVLSLLRSAADAGAGVVLVTHSPAVADSADTVIRLLDGVRLA